MAGPLGITVYRQWHTDPGLLTVLRGLYVYGPGDNRATGYLYSEGDQRWSVALAEQGTALLDGLETLLTIRFTVVAFQAYRNGAGCDWHEDKPFDAQAVLSLGDTRTFGVRSTGGDDVAWLSVHHGDLVYMPPGFQDHHQHCVPVEDVTGERCSLVFRTVKRSST